MNDVSELKQFAEVHARAQYIHDYQEILDRIATDEGDTAGSWVHEWTRAAQSRLRDGDYLDACRFFNMARFPYVDDPARQYALERCVSAFEQWRAQRRPSIERLDLDLPGGTVGCWADGLSTRDKRPVLLIMGGIVSIKEQWAQALVPLRRLGMATIATEMPGVGQNTMRYESESWKMLPAILDAVADRAKVAETYALAASFSGHMSLRCAYHDSRIRGVASVGAPISRFFTDAGWQHGLPALTKSALEHATGLAFGDLCQQFPQWRLSEQELSTMDPVICYLASRDDEVIPTTDIDYLRRYARHLHLVEYDDVHASPRHVAESRLWTVLSVLRMRGAHTPQRLLAEVLWRTLRARARLTARGTGPRPGTARDSG